MPEDACVHRVVGYVLQMDLVQVCLCSSYSILENPNAVGVIILIMLFNVEPGLKLLHIFLPPPQPQVVSSKHLS